MSAAVTLVLALSAGCVSTPQPAGTPPAAPSATTESTTPTDAAEPSDGPSETAAEKRAAEKRAEKRAAEKRAAKKARLRAAEKKAAAKAEKKAEKKAAEKASEASSKKATGSRTIYLTFDDGPSAYTGRVLDILDRYDAKATFFVIGQNVGGRKSLVRKMKRAGHTVENHTWDHADLRTLSAAGIRSQIRRTDNAVAAAGGGRSSCVRPPYGATNSTVRSVLRGLDKRQVLWDVDTLDWQAPGTSKIYRSVVDNARSGSIVLSHDGGGTRTQTVAALPRILKTLSDRGYRFRALCT